LISLREQRVFVANRGEVAVRILAACRELGMQTVLGVSTADRDTMSARLADRTLTIGGARSADSYLNIEAVLHAALATGCTAVHPGYGFLSENAEFARRCRDEGLVFIGPSPEALEALGDKTRARELAHSLGLPIAPGGRAGDAAAVWEIAGEVGYPLLIKAAHGGGGKGMKLVQDPGELIEAWQTAAAEAEQAFGDGTVFIERFVGNARHIEVQIIGDRSGRQRAVGLRECSMQHRYQKVIEEAGTGLLPAHHEQALVEGSLTLAKELNYVGLGTVEFLYDQGREFVSFLEVNPRLQVEHPVTEAVTGRDLVRDQILACLTEGPDMPDPVDIVGHAIECRITAQDPDRDLMPSPGVVTRWRPPRRGGVRIDSHIYEGYRFPPYYDALMGKLIVWGTTREEAVARLGRAMADFEVDGSPSNMSLLRRIVGHADFRSGAITTTWLTKQLAERTL
jgi:acetyl-CoA carboxylase biotin carboxylase subunit